MIGMIVFLLVFYELFLDLKEELHDKIKSKSISIGYSTEENLILQSDRLLLTFILKQTLENAIKYSNKDGEVVFIASFKHNELSIEIEDNGVGMTNKVQSNIFTLNGSPYKGTMDEVGAGLSLVVVKHFVEKLGGNMEVVSKPNEGTAVKYIFPTNV